VAAVITGQGFFSQGAEAALGCCTGRSCGIGGCPSGTSVGYTWGCGGHRHHRSFCHDCFAGRHYVCTYVS
jgi:hypothetical protein